MQHRTLPLLAGLVATALTALTGCPAVHLLHLQLPGFDSSPPLGLEVVHLDATTGQPVAVGSIELGEATLDAGGMEVVPYEVVLASGQRLTNLWTQVLRSPGTSDLAEVYLYFPAPTPSGLYQVASYNEAGTSSLSAPAYVR